MDLPQRNSTTVKAQCQSMFPMECIWSIAGRFLVTSSAGHLGWYSATLVGASYMEFFMRINSEPLEGMWLEYISGLPPLTGQALTNYRLAESCNQAQDDAVEQGAIILTAGVQYFLYTQQAAVSLGFFGNPEPTLNRVLKIAGTQLAAEIPTDIVTTAQLIDGGLNVHTYYDDIDEDGVITPHTVMMKIGEMFSFQLALGAMIMFFRIAPIPGFCIAADICKCVIYTEETAAQCGL